MDGFDLYNNFGLFELLWMSFRLRNAAQTFQHFMNNVLQSFDFAYAYNDDIQIARSSPEEHLENFQSVFLQLDDHRIVLNVSKSHFSVSDLDFLKLLVNATGICPLVNKVQIIQQFPRPNTTQVTEISVTSDLLPQVRAQLSFNHYTLSSIALYVVLIHSQGR